MIRLILRDLFPTRAQVGALRARVAELEHDNKAIGEAYARVNSYNARLHDECERLEAENADLRKRALRPTPTPGEARMLEIVRANPGALSSDLGRLAWQQDADYARSAHLAEYSNDDAHAFWNRPLVDGDTRIGDAARPLTGLHKKSLVRREKSGNTYRYWATT